MLIVLQYEQKKITRMIAILKKRKTHFSHLTYWTVLKVNDSSGKKAPNLYSPDKLICMDLTSGRIFAAFFDLQSYIQVTYGKNFRCVAQNHLTYWTVLKVNDSSGKKAPNLYSPDKLICMDLTSGRIFAAFFDLQSYIQVTYGKNFRCVAAKLINNFDRKSQSLHGAQLVPPNFDHQVSFSRRQFSLARLFFRHEFCFRHDFFFGTTLFWHDFLFSAPFFFGTKKSCRKKYLCQRKLRSWKRNLMLKIR